MRRSNKFCWTQATPGLRYVGHLERKGTSMTQAPPNPQQEYALGLTKTGLIVFIILLVVCLPLCWLPWVIKSLKATKS